MFITNIYCSLELSSRSLQYVGLTKTQQKIYYIMQVNLQAKLNNRTSESTAQKYRTIRTYIRQINDRYTVLFFTTKCRLNGICSGLARLKVFKTMDLFRFGQVSYLVQLLLVILKGMQYNTTITITMKMSSYEKKHKNLTLTLYQISINFSNKTNLKYCLNDSTIQYCTVTNSVCIRSL